MAVWGETSEEVTQKLEVAIKEMKNLGLKLSLEKTELQHNQFQIPSMEGETLKMKVGKQQYPIQYLSMNKAIRYLGIWSTANLETEKGIQLLKEKLQERLNRI